MNPYLNIYTGHVDMVNVLLECGADANIMNKKKRTPLHIAFALDKNKRNYSSN